ncbi:DASH family cryptochrome [Subsaxibacter sp. CAU 1640]|uniref:DASH family cryptochrome n=1 Tax=Subsaxibacter sp. CAU 1640 TaxID=2933271 RepID=UPI002004F90A|nr:DASH family cryptochrome [Subsaxibacter sp. CAU 1640]MCK7591253.1 DASH family cryptochrome [Subsaxibacter sp. CAU 1640]
MQKTQEQPSLIWFRNDLRIHDNPVLTKAIASGNPLLAVFCFDPRHYEVTEYGFKKTQKYRAQFLIESSQDLKSSLKKIGISLLVFHDKPENVIPSLVSKYDIDEIYYQTEWTTEEVDVLNAVKANLPENVTFHQEYGQFLIHPDDFHIDIDNLPKIFTEFRKQVEKRCKVRAEIEPSFYHNNFSPSEITEIPSLEDLGFENFETHPNSAFPFNGGETEALKRLEEYIFKSQKIAHYKQTRNGLIGTDYSSKFSAWLANGCLSPRKIYWSVKQFEKEHVKNESTYWLIFELLWRDYFKYSSLEHGANLFKLGGIKQKDLTWDRNEQLLHQWMSGTTEEPFVNANMLELNQTGWMSNRGRQNVASYLSKTLKQDWRIGAAYFESLLIDYDVHSNYGNWNYVAGVGNDPRDREFNVKLQAERYDGSGRYQRLWLQKTLFE